MRSAFAALLLTILTGLTAATAQVSQLNFHNDLSSDGENLAETQLTPSTVTQASFGKIFSAAVDGQVYSEPLYVPSVTITAAGAAQNTAHSVVYVCTEHDSVYAIDSTNGAVLWNITTLGSGEITVPSNDVGTADLTPEIGITSTPVISATADGNGARWLYCVAKSRNTISGLNHYYLRFHAINIANGAEKAGSPVLIAETVVNSDGTYQYLSGPSCAGTGDGTVNGVVTMNALRSHQRCSLSLLNGIVYFGSASHGTNGPYHGWVLGYNATSLAQTAVWCVSPNGGLAGVWMGGNLITTDSTGSLYLATGNGTFGLYNAGRDPIPSDFDSNGFPLSHNYGDSMVRLVVDSSTASNPNSNGWGLKIVDYFCPIDERMLDSGDLDLGSGGVVILPDSVGSAAHPKLLVCGGKEGRIYLVDRNNMGKFSGGVSNGAFNASGDACVQVTAPSTVHGILSTAAYFSGNLYYAGGYTDRGKEFAIANGVLNATPIQQTPDNYGYLGSTPVVSSNGSNNAVVWCVDRGTNQLRAYLASNFSSELYTSGQAANTRDQLGTAVKFGVPTVLNGFVYVGTSEPAGPSALVCYGLLSAPTNPPAQPSNLYAQTVSGGEIDLFWTDNATNESGYETYVSTDPVNFPQTPYATSGVASTSTAVMGLTPNTNYYFRVRAVNAAGDSAYSNAAGTTSSQPAPVDFSNGFAANANLLNGNGFNGTAPVNGAVLRLTDGNQNEARSVWLKTPQIFSNFTTEFDFLETAPDADGFTFTLQQVGSTAVGGSGGGLAAGLNPSVTVKFDIFPSLSTTGLYLDGATPDDNTSPTSMSSGAIDTTAAGVDFHSGHTMRVALTYNGSTSTLLETITDLTTRAVFSHSYSLTIASALSGGSTAYVGFTASSGGETATQDILGWSFSSTLPTTPVAPSGLSVSASSGTQLDLTWTDNSNNETGFRIYRKTGSSGTYAIVGSVGANTTVYHDTGLLVNTTYYYQVAATNASLVSGLSNEAYLTTPVAPATPSNPQTTYLSSTRCDFTWVDNANNETGYRILRQAGTSDFITLTTLPANTTSYSDTTLSPDTLYDYHIQAYNAAGNVDFAGLVVNTPSSVSIAVTDASAQIGTSDTGAFAVSRTNALTTALTVNYTVATGSGQAAAGTRYTLTPAAGTVTIPANALSAPITVVPASSGSLLGPQAVTLTLATGTGYTPVLPGPVSVTLQDDPIDAWKISAFGSVAAAQSAAAADSADFDGDGIPNLVEYALGSNPALRNPSAAPRAATENVDGGLYQTLTFTRPKPAPTTVAYVPQYKADLTSMTWANAVMVGGYPLDNGNGTETVKVRATMTVSAAGGKGFMRLQINRQ